MNNKEFIEKMEALAQNNEATELRKKVATMLIDQLDGYDTPLQMFQDLQHGCESGIVGGLIYYVDTHAFAKEYIEDILEMFQEAQEEYELQMPKDQDLLNWLAWFGFEETARSIGLEIYPDDL